MKKINLSSYMRILLVAFICVLINNISAESQVRITAGAKAWYATWNLPIQKYQGTNQSDFSPAFLVGPYISIRVSQFAATVSYSKTIKTFDATAENTGFIDIGFNGNRMVSREDINVFVNYSFAPEVSLFANVKLMNYKRKDALTWISGIQRRDEEGISGTGFGLGFQFATPFSGGSPFYTFISTGAVFNSFKSDKSTETGSELVYFLDGGLGMRFIPTSFGGAIGIRVENGKDTKTIIGPTVNLFYTF